MLYGNEQLNRKLNKKKNTTYSVHIQQCARLLSMQWKFHDSQFTQTKIASNFYSIEQNYFILIDIYQDCRYSICYLKNDIEMLFLTGD